MSALRWIKSDTHKSSVRAHTTCAGSFNKSLGSRFTHLPYYTVIFRENREDRRSLLCSWRGHYTLGTLPQSDSQNITIDHEKPTAVPSQCSNATPDNNNNHALLTPSTPTCDVTPPVEYSIPDEFYHVPDESDLDLDVLGKPSADLTEAVPQIDPVAVQTPPVPRLPTETLPIWRTRPTCVPAALRTPSERPCRKWCGFLLSHHWPSRPIPKDCHRPPRYIRQMLGEVHAGWR